MPRSADSDLGLHCLPMPLLWDARLKWVILPNQCQENKMEPTFGHMNLSLSLLLSFAFGLSERGGDIGEWVRGKLSDRLKIQFGPECGPAAIKLS